MYMYEACTVYNMYGSYYIVLYVTLYKVFKDGKPALKERAEKSKVYLVSPLWVEA